MRRSLLILSILCLLAVGCGTQAMSLPTSAPSPVAATQAMTATTSPTPSPSMTPSPTSLPSATATHTPSATPSATATPLPTSTATPSATPTPTATPTSTRIPSPRGVLVGVDPGHGGRDLGARHFNADGHMDFYESEIVLDIGLRLARLLKEEGYAVVMTRDGDYYLNDKERLDINGDGWYDEMDQLQQRVDILNAAGVDLFVSLHLNAYEGEDADTVGGTTTYYCAARPFSDQSLRLAQLIQERTLSALAELGYAARDRGVRLDLQAGTPGEHLILLGPEDQDCARASEMPGALSESLFITNEAEAKLLQQESVRERLAQAIVQAINDYVEEVGLGGPEH